MINELRVRAGITHTFKRNEKKRSIKAIKQAYKLWKTFINEKKYSREFAAEMLGVSASSMRRYRRALERY